MIVYENECVGCPPEMGCLGVICPNRRVPHYYCDECGEETEHLNDYFGEDLCEFCFEKRGNEDESK